MIKKITQKLPQHTITITNAKDIYIVDYKNLNRGDIALFEDNEPQDIKAVHLENKRPIEIAFDGFAENALPIEDESGQCRQCECVLFPKKCDENDWILFIEMKYANDLKAALKSESNYPYNMVEQIKQTVHYFRQKGIIEQSRRVNAIVSFPNLVEEFSAHIFQSEIDDLIYKHNIRLRATNSAIIKSEKRITLNAI